MTSLSTSPKRENRLTALSPPYAERPLALRDGRVVTLRAVSAGDGAEIIQAFDRLSTDSRYSRFMQHKKQLDPAALSRGLNPERGREFVLLATIPAADGIDIVGAAQYLQADVNNATSCEFAITLAAHGHASAKARLSGRAGVWGRDGGARFARVGLFTTPAANYWVTTSCRAF